MSDALEEVVLALQEMFEEAKEQQEQEKNRIYDPEAIYLVEADSTDPWTDGGRIWALAYVKGDPRDIRTYYEAKRAAESKRGKWGGGYSIHVREITIEEVTPEMAEDAKALVDRVKDAEKDLDELE